MKEANIEINGRQCSLAMSMTIRVAIESFASDLAYNGLGDDEIGKAMTQGYLGRIEEVRALIMRED